MNRTNWRDVPVPDKMRLLRRDERGFPVPFVVFYGLDGKPLFAVNDAKKVSKCLNQKLCPICSEELYDDMWMIGGCRSAFHPNGAYIDTPVHHECGEYAMRVCPYLAITAYKPDISDAKIGKNGGDYVFTDPTVDPNRPPVFVLAKTSGYSIAPATRYLTPVRPFLAVEFWNAGDRIPDEDGYKIINSLNLPTK